MKYNKYYPFLLIAGCFLLLKLSNIGIRLSDTNIYFYTGHLLLQGKLLYKDVFFTNFPLFPYISSLYVLLTGGHLPFYYLTAPIEAVFTSFLIYLILLRQYKNALLPAVCTALYLFSFILLATTEHQTGVFLASFFAVASYYCYLEKKYLLTGIFIACAFMTKAYFLPILLTYVVLIFWTEKKRGGESNKKQIFTPHVILNLFQDRQYDILKFIGGFSLTVLVILLPTFLFARADFFRDVIDYSLTRSQGLSKMNILWFFLTHDILLVASLVYSIIMVRTYRFFGLLSIFGIMFIIFYKDIYYLYLNFMIPFLVLAFANLYQDIEKRVEMQKMILPTIIGIVLIINLFIYLNGYRNLEKLADADVARLTTTIKHIQAPSIYGSNGLTHAIAYLTDTPLVNKITDTNPNLFKKGFLNASTLTKQALDEKAVFITEGFYYPEIGVNQPVSDEVIDIKQLQNRKCSLLTSVPIQTEGQQNIISLITCN